jgi:hypothetical protein
MPYSDDGHDVPKYVTGGDKKRRKWSHVWNSEYKRQKGKGKSDKEAEQIAFASANSVASKTVEARFAKLLSKASNEEAEQFAVAVIAALEEEARSLPSQIRGPLESAMTSGIGEGLMQIEISDSGLISSANEIAQKYASERAAELVGMRYNDEGELVANPNAEWAISDHTRNRIREIISESFTEDTPLPDIQASIREALQEEAEDVGIFSEARAAMIARTEVMMAQNGGNYTTWEKSGVVKKVKWLTSNLEPCEECVINSTKEITIGKIFPSGHKMPPAHPRCSCVLTVSRIAD